MALAVDVSSSFFFLIIYLRYAFLTYYVDQNLKNEFSNENDLICK